MLARSANIATYGLYTHYVHKPKETHIPSVMYIPSAIYHAYWNYEDRNIQSTVRSTTQPLF